MMGKILFAMAFALGVRGAAAQQALTLEVAMQRTVVKRVAPQPADLVLTNGTVITLRATGDRAQAVAVTGDRIVAVGDTNDIKAYIGTATRVIDLHGRTVTPGFNDVHQHPAPIYTWEKPYASLELDTVTSMRSLIALLRRKAAVTPKGMTIRGTAYNEVKLGAQPIRDSLDEASTDHPIIISQAGGHDDRGGTDSLSAIKPIFMP